MKTKIVLFALFVALATMGFTCVNDPIIVTVNLDDVDGCWTVNPGPGTFSSTITLTVRSEIDSNISATYRNSILSLRLYDIIVKVQGTYPAGLVTGDVFFDLNSLVANRRLFQFRGQYSDYANGISLFNQNFITPDNNNVTALVGAFSDINNLPQSIALRGTGSGPAVTQNFQLCCILKFQAEANAQ